MEFVEPGLAAAVALVFLATGTLRLIGSRGGAAAAGGRRAIGPSPATVLVSRLRGVAEILGSLGVAASAGVALVAGPRFASVGWWSGLALAALGLWTALESLRPPLRAGRIVVALASFLLAVFFLGFRD